MKNKYSTTVFAYLTKQERLNLFKDKNIQKINLSSPNYILNSIQAYQFTEENKKLLNCKFKIFTQNFQKEQIIIYSIINLNSIEYFLNRFQNQYVFVIHKDNFKYLFYKLDKNYDFKNHLSITESFDKKLNFNFHNQIFKKHHGILTILNIFLDSIIDYEKHNKFNFFDSDVIILTNLNHPNILKIKEQFEENDK
jgi:hypothetical protein